MLSRPHQEKGVIHVYHHHDHVHMDAHLTDTRTRTRTMYEWVPCFKRYRRHEESLWFYQLNILWFLMLYENTNVRPPVN